MMFDGFGAGGDVESGFGVVISGCLVVVQRFELLEIRKLF